MAAPRKVDQWWMVLIAFAAAAAMVLLVLLTESDQAVGGPAPTTPSIPFVHTATQAPHVWSEAVS